MKSKVLSILVFVLAGFLWACSDDEEDLGMPLVNVNGGPLEESITPTSARVKIVLNRVTDVKEVGVCYGVQSDKSALINYGEVLKAETIDSVIYLDINDVESATTYSYVAYAKMGNGTPDAYSVVRSFTTQSADLYLTPARLKQTATGCVDTVVVKTTFDSWELSEYTYDWVSYEKKDTLLILTTKDNLTDGPAVATLKLTAGSRTQSLTITKDIPKLSLSSDTLEISAKGVTNQFFKVISDVKWSAQDDPEATWCVSRVSHDTVYYNAEVNTGADEREARIKVKVSDQIYKEFVVVQRSGALALTKTVLSYGLKGGADGFSVECSTDDWTFSSDKNWCKPVRIQGTDSIVVTVDPNSTDINTRTAVITVQTSEQNKKTVRVSQASGLSLSSDNVNKLGFYYGNGTITVNSWTNDWTIAVVDNGGKTWRCEKTNDQTATVYADQMNNEAGNYTAVVRVTAGTLTADMTVVQLAAQIGLPKTLDFSYKAGTKKALSANTIWMTKYKLEGEAGDDLSWITISSGNLSFTPDANGYMVGSATFIELSVTLGENKTGKTRTARLTGVWEGVSETITITQKDISSVTILPDLGAGVLAGSYTVTNEGEMATSFFGPVITKADFVVKADKYKADGIADYENGGGNRWEVFKGMDYDYAIGVNSVDGFVYPCLFKVTNQESSADGAPAGAYHLEMVALEEPANQQGDGTSYMFKQNAAWYDPVTKTLYFDFVYWGNRRMRTLVFSE